MRIYSTCATCGNQLDVTPDMPAGYMTHPGCPSPCDPLTLLRRAYLEAAQRDDDDATALAEQLDQFDGRAPQLHAAALLYAAWGWPVFPCRRGLKSPATAHGLKEATTDPDQVTEWWSRWPHANVAVATGHAFDVIDVDPPGAPWWRQHGHEHGPLPDLHGHVSTPRVLGAHLYVEPTGMGNKSGLAPGVDYRGVGGYVLVPPSVVTRAAYGGKSASLATHPVYTWTVYPSPVIKPAAAGPGVEQEAGG